MHSVELLDEALQLAAELGFDVRHEWLDGQGGGACQLKGRRLLFVDLAQSPAEQFDVVAQALADVYRRQPFAVSAGLKKTLRLRSAA